MIATIRYKMAYLPHPWNTGSRAEGEKAWCLVKVVKPEHGATTEEPVAIFNWDSEAETFQGHVYAAGLDGKLIDIDRDVRELFELRSLNAAKARLAQDP